MILYLKDTATTVNIHHTFPAFSLLSHIQILLLLSNLLLLKVKYENFRPNVLWISHHAHPTLNTVEKVSDKAQILSLGLD